jgi:hypothetical protein
MRVPVDMLVEKKKGTRYSYAMFSNYEICTILVHFNLLPITIHELI